MSDAALATVDTVIRIRSAQREAARSQYIAAEQNLKRVSDREGSVAELRDAAARGWKELLQSPVPDPHIIRLAGIWLVNRERDLTAAHLDTEIAQDRHVMAREQMEQARAQLDASIEVRSKRARQIERRREELELTRAADLFLQRWRR